MKIEEAVSVLSVVPGQKWFKAGLVTTGVGAVGVAVSPLLVGTKFGSLVLPGTVTWTTAALIGYVSKGVVILGAGLMLKGLWDGVRLGMAAVRPQPDVKEKVETLEKGLQEITRILKQGLSQTPPVR